MQNNESFLESRIQADCFQWHWNHFPDERRRLFMVYNTPRNPIAGAILKGMGMVKGVSDMIYLSDSGAVFLEFKRPNEYQTKEQRGFEVICVELGYKYFVITSVEQFKEVVNASRKANDI